MVYHTDRSSVHGAVVVGLCVTSLIYLLFGGLMFYYLEKEGQNVYRKKMVSDLGQFIGNFSCVRRQDLLTLLDAVSPVYDQDIAWSTLADKQPTSWSYADSVLLSTALISTVGFGTYYPKTVEGRAACVLYAIFGISLLIISVDALGVKVAGAFRRFDNWIAPGAEYESCSPKKWLIRLRVMITAAIGTLLFLIIPAVFFTETKQLTFNEALYAVFMTLSTIGLRNGLPLSNNGSAYFWAYFFLFSCWLYFGFVSVYLLLSAVINATTHVISNREIDDVRPAVMTEKQYGTLGLSDCSKELFETSSTASLRSSASSLVNFT